MSKNSCTFAVEFEYRINMKKFFSLFAAILFAGVMIADTYGVTAVTSFVSGDKYVFYQDGHVIDGSINYSKLVPLTTFAKTNLAGTESYVWTVEASGDGWLLKSAAGTYLANAEKGNLSLEAAGTVWEADFSDGTLLLTNPSNADRFLGLNAEGTGYKSYNQQNIDVYPHAITVYHLEVGATGEIGNGEIPSVDPQTITLDVAYADASYYSEAEYWQINVYKDYDPEMDKVTYPDLYIGIDGQSATSFAGTYAADDLYYLEMDLSKSKTVEAVSSSNFVITCIEPYVYRYQITFVADDNNTYILDATLETAIYDGETYEDIEPTDEPQAIENTEAPVKAVKAIRDGKLTIIKGNKMYNVNGAQVR